MSPLFTKTNVCVCVCVCVCVSISVCVRLFLYVCVVDVFWDAGLWESKNALVPAETLAVTPRLHLLLIHTLLCQATRSLTLCSDGCGGEGKSWHDVFWWSERELGFVWEGGPSQHEALKLFLVRTFHRQNSSAKKWFTITPNPKPHNWH